MGVSTDGLLFYGIILEEGEDISNELYDKTEFNDRSEIGIENYCSGDYPIYAITIKKSVISANRGSPKKVNGVYEKNQDWDMLLDKFCIENNINYSNKPNWYLASYWG